MSAARPRPASCGRARLAAAVEAERRAQAGRLDGLDWYALSVVSRAEFEAIADLRRRGLFAWCPTKTLWRYANRFAKRKTARTFAAVPGFVFLGTAGPVRWDAALSAAAVRGVLGDAGRPRRLSPAAVGWAMARSSTAPAVEQWMRSGREFGVGDAVTVVGAGLQGRVLAIEGRQARLMATLLGAEREVMAGLGELALAS